MRPTRLLLTLTALALLPAAGPTFAQTLLAQTLLAQTLLAQGSQSIPAIPPKSSSTPAPAVTAPATPALSREAALKRGRQLVTWFYDQNLGPVWAAFLPSARANFGGDLDAFKSYRASGVTTYGKESRLLSEEVQAMDGVTYYLRTATFERGPRVQWTLAFGLDSLGRVVNFGILGGTEAAPDQQALAGGRRL